MLHAKLSLIGTSNTISTLGLNTMCAQSCYFSLSKEQYLICFAKKEIHLLIVTELNKMEREFINQTSHGVTTQCFITLRYRQDTTIPPCYITSLWPDQFDPNFCKEQGAGLSLTPILTVLSLQAASSSLNAWEHLNSPPPYTPHFTLSICTTSKQVLYSNS